MKIKRILIVDDDATFQSMTKLFLEENGYKVITENNGKSGFERALTEKPDLILLDIIMPVENGLITVDRLLADPVTKNIPIIVNSSYPTATKVAYGKNVVGVYNKGESNEELLSLIEKISAGRALV